MAPQRLKALDPKDADDLEILRSGKMDDEIIVEIIFITTFHIFNNYLNAVARTQLGFPPAPDLPQYQA